MRRRDFLSRAGGAAAMFLAPRAGLAQQPGRMRRIGLLHTQAAGDPESQGRVIALVQALQELGWTDGRNVRIDSRWSAGNAADTRKYAEELVALAPDVILTGGVAGV